MRRFILAVTGVVAMLLGSVMFLAAPAMADVWDEITYDSSACREVTVHNGHTDNISIFNDAAQEQLAVPAGGDLTFTVPGTGSDATFRVGVYDPTMNGGSGGTDTRSVTVATACAVAPTEVTPVAPTQSGNVVTIPTVACVTYSVSGSPVTGTITLTKNTTVDATADQGCVLASGAKSSWTFAYTPPVIDPDPVFDPRASIVLHKDGSGTATLNNTGSTEPVGFEVVVNGRVTSVMVPAGKSVQSAFKGAKCGTAVVVNALDTRVAKKSMAACPKPTPTPDSDPVDEPKDTPNNTDNNGPKPSYVAPNTGAANEGASMMPVGLMGVGGLLLAAAAGLGLRRRLMN